jgi:proteasome lid subunit RPN8/RPN11
MSQVYPDINKWAVPEAALTKTVAAVLPAGLAGRESGVFWLGKRSTTATVTALVLPSGQGVEELPEQWRVSPAVFGAISLWAKPKHLALLAIAHIHLPGIPTALSWADRNLSVQVPGILAIVIGNGGADRDHSHWSWYVYSGNEYRKMTIVQLKDRLSIRRIGGLSTWRADASGVYEVEI